MGCSWRERCRRYGQQCSCKPLAPFWCMAVAPALPVLTPVPVGRQRGGVGPRPSGSATRPRRDAGSHRFPQTWFRRRGDVPALPEREPAARRKPPRVPSPAAPGPGGIREQPGGRRHRHPGRRACRGARGTEPGCRRCCGRMAQWQRHRPGAEGDLASPQPRGRSGDLAAGHVLPGHPLANLLPESAAAFQREEGAPVLTPCTSSSGELVSSRELRSAAKGREQRAGHGRGRGGRLRHTFSSPVCGVLFGKNNAAVL